MVAEQTLDCCTLLEKQQQRLAAFLQWRDPQQRLARLVEEARHRPALAPEFRVEAYRVQGCLARSWFVPGFRVGNCYFRCDSDAVTLKAVIGLLCEILSGHSPEEIAAADPNFVRKLGILHQLAENRQNTILRVAEQMRSFAATHQRLAA